MSLGPSELNFLYGLALEAIHEAGEKILSLDSDKGGYNSKKDGSPLTPADLSSHAVIKHTLARSEIELVSEESSDLHLGSPRYWLVDPLDGTKDYLAKNGEYAINIALIENSYPVLGIIYNPVTEKLTGAIKNMGAWQHSGSRVQAICGKPKTYPLRMGVSRFHHSVDVQPFVQRNDVRDLIPIGASNKYCALALGQIDVYLRLVGTSEWDTAAGQIILEETGGGGVDLKVGKRNEYGKLDRRNNSFIAYRDPYEFLDFNLGGLGLDE